MHAPHARISATAPRLSRLGELLARAGARNRRAQEIPEAPRPEETAAADPIETLFRVHGSLSTGEIMDQTGKSRTTVHRRVTELVEAGVLEPRGKGRACRYHHKSSNL